jgi:hypothetical protein
VRIWVLQAETLRATGELNHELNRLFDSKVDDCNVVAASALVTPATKERSVGVHARSRSST